MTESFEKEDKYEKQIRDAHDALAPKFDPLGLLRDHRGSVVEIQSRSYIGGIVPRSWLDPNHAVNAGTGFVVGADAHGCDIATDAHNFDGSKTADVWFDDGRHYKGNLAHYDSANDLAIVRITGVPDPAHECPVLPVARGTVPPDTPVLKLTRHQQEDEWGTVGPYNKLSSYRSELLPGENVNRTILETQVDIKPGNSGGPILAVVDGQAQVIGVADKSYADSHLFNISTPSYYLAQDIDALRKRK